MTLASDCEAMVATAVERFGALDILVNNSDRRTPEEVITSHASVIDHILGRRSKAASRARPDAARTVGEHVIAGLVENGVIDAP